MIAFAALLDRLLLTPSRTDKLRILGRYFRATPDPDRGWALAALCGSLHLGAAKPAMLRALIAERMDAELFALSYDYVGDLAETIALAWPTRPGANRAPDLNEVVARLRGVNKAQSAGVIEPWLDALDAQGRWALLKLITGGFRIGAGARLAKQALAEAFDKPLHVIEDVWPALDAPYPDLFAWLTGAAPNPPQASVVRFYPVMLAHPLDGYAALNRADFAAEWKWDGVRVQAVRAGGQARLFSRTGEDIGAAFPDVLAGLDFDGAIDGELLVRRDDRFIGDFNDLQQRLNRKTVDKKLLARLPGFIRAYDLLQFRGLDLRQEPFHARRERLTALIAEGAGAAVDLSPLVEAPDWDGLAALRTAPPDPAIEGLMLKRWDSRYEQGRVTGLWWKWKRDPHLVDCVLMYAQRGHGKRSSFYSDFTFGVWSAGALTPVGKAYFGFTDEELKQLDKFVRDHTIEKFGPVRAVEAKLVVEIAFEGLARSTRHKSGLAMRFPRIHRIRWDKPAAQADELTTLERLLAPAGS